MKRCFALGAAFAVVALCGVAVAEEALKSGPQVGKGCRPFHPLNVTNVYAPKKAGTKNCFV